MANTLTNLTETILQDEILPALKLGLVPLNAFSTRVGSDNAITDNVILVPLAAAKTAGTYAGSWQSGDSTTTSASVTWEAPTFSAWYIDPAREAFPTVERWLSQGREAAYAVAQSVLQDVLANFVAANINDVADTDKKVVTAANYEARDQADLWSMLSTKGVGRATGAIHTIAYAAALFKDNVLLDKSASDSNVLQTGELPPILGVRQFFTDAFPAAVTNENTGVIYTGPTTAAVALGVPNKIEEGLETAAGVQEMLVTDPDGTGLSLVWRQWVDSATGYYWGAIYISKGDNFVQNAAVRVTSA